MNDGITPDALPPAPDAHVTPPPRAVPPESPPPSAASSRQVQWVIAAVLLAGLVFVAVFAMNYLPSMLNTQAPPPNLGDSDSDLALTFPRKNGPPIEAEL